MTELREMRCWASLCEIMCRELQERGVIFQVGREGKWIPVTVITTIVNVFQPSFDSGVQYTLEALLREGTPTPIATGGSYSAMKHAARMRKRMRDKLSDSQHIAEPRVREARGVCDHVWALAFDACIYEFFTNIDTQLEVLTYGAVGLFGHPHRE